MRTFQCARTARYLIPDPAGFYIPIVTLLALPLALACVARDSYQWLRLGVLASCLAVSAWQQAQSAGRLIGNELVYNLGGRKGIAWDLSDVFSRIPEGASFAQPCTAYGCVELINYYRFADHTAQRRKIQFVQLPGMDSMHYAYAPMEVLPWTSADERVVCTLHKGEAKRLTRSGAALQTIERQAQRIGNKDYPGVPIYCAQPVRN
jgi:hypothetical protein